MNKRVSFVAVIVWMVAGCANAQLLWKISGNGLVKPSYLFGTHHLIDKDRIKGFDQILALSGKADAVVGEMDLNNPDIKATMEEAEMMQDTTLKELLTPQDYAMVDYEFKNLMQVGLSQLGNVKPMLLDMMFSVMMYTKMMGFSKQPEGVDVIFQKNAEANHKKVIGLETPEQEANILFNTIPLERQADILMNDIKHSQQGLEQVNELTTAYLAGNMVRVETLNDEDDSLTPAEKQLMFDDRNAAWMKELPGLIKKQSCFIDVGFIHLIGKSGLIHQLRKLGYTVEPLLLQEKYIHKVAPGYNN
ncbi:TraB/GumN family protein [Microbacter margulisiae]|uniref:TraB/GumN family protein n=1 Tax=Microbacter margulisiae TaxID=1350067 RepID=A0A7W5H3H1_9PORP|nr:TraB/GumN family protein [Microbacter margulisiae]MBB3188584.1 hypothetical protein [Microbacter margulisiae]